MSEPKQHHYIPDTYLENFCAEDGTLWLYDKWEGRSFPGRPENVLRQHMYYAQPDHENKSWNYNIEHFFSNKIETHWPKTVEIIENGPQSTRELKNLYMFLYATRVRVPNCRKAVEYALQQQVRAISSMIKEPKYLEDERNGIALINKHLNSAFQSMDEIYDAGVINITIDPHRSLLAMADLAKGFALVVLSMQFHFIRNRTPIDFNCSDNPIVYFPAGQQPNACTPYQFRLNRPFEFIFPITKRLCLYHNSHCPIGGQQIVSTETKDCNFVRRLNNFVGAFADRFVVSTKELSQSDLPTRNLCPRLSVFKNRGARGTFLLFKYEMGEPLKLPKWRTRFDAS